MQEIIKLLVFFLCFLYMIIDNNKYMNYFGWTMLILFILTSKLIVCDGKLDFEWGLIKFIERIMYD